MRSKPIIPMYIIRDVVNNRVNPALINALKLLDPQITKINFQPGTIVEIQNTLTKMSQQPSQEYSRYPLFGLIMSFKELKGKQIGIDNTAKLNIVIARRSNATDRTEQRYENNIIPFLYPIYYEFLHQLDADKRFLTKGQDLIPHVKIDYPYYNGDPSVNSNPLGDWVDAIVIQDMELNFNLKNC